MGKTKLSSCSHIHGSAPKIERKVIEKNRRSRLKILYSELFSLLPSNQASRESLALPDQIDEAVKYIEAVKSKLQIMRQKKESLSRANFRTPESILTTDQYQPTSTPLVEVQDMGPNMDVILANGLADYSMFLAIIHNLLRKDGAEVANANFSVRGSSSIHVLHDKVEKSKSSYGGETSTGRLKGLICGSSSSEVAESQLNVWDYGIESNIWDLVIQEVPFSQAGFY
ncbi:transcription factor bHLH162-like [Primulina huaijiensis]|uniref:transcription factor bHLH162-like n=1 Tax=Primulina huaijiensis TaxID=1492673 RepID=UPI003CC737AD